MVRTAVLVVGAMVPLGTAALTFIIVVAFFTVLGLAFLAVMGFAFFTMLGLAFLAVMGLAFFTVLGLAFLTVLGLALLVVIAFLIVVAFLGLAVVARVDFWRSLSLHRGMRVAVNDDWLLSWPLWQDRVLGALLICSLGKVCLEASLETGLAVHDRRRVQGEDGREGDTGSVWLGALKRDSDGGGSWEATLWLLRVVHVDLSTAPWARRLGSRDGRVGPLSFDGNGLVRRLHWLVVEHGTVAPVTVWFGISRRRLRHGVHLGARNGERHVLLLALGSMGLLIAVLFLALCLVPFDALGVELSGNLELFEQDVEIQMGRCLDLDVNVSRFVRSDWNTRDAWHQRGQGQAECGVGLHIGGKLRSVGALESTKQGDKRRYTERMLQCTVIGADG